MSTVTTGQARITALLAATRPGPGYVRGVGPAIVDARRFIAWGDHVAADVMLTQAEAYVTTARRLAR